MTDLADYLSEPIREEHIRQVRKKINELSIDYIYSQYISITGRIMGKAIPASHWERLAAEGMHCLLYTSPSPRDATLSRMPSSA